MRSYLRLPRACEACRAQNDSCAVVRAPQTRRFESISALGGRRSYQFVYIAYTRRTRRSSRHGAAVTPSGPSSTESFIHPVSQAIEESVMRTLNPEELKEVYGGTGKSAPKHGHGKHGHSKSKSKSRSKSRSKSKHAMRSKSKSKSRHC